MIVGVCCTQQAMLSEKHLSRSTVTSYVDLELGEH